MRATRNYKNLSVEVEADNQKKLFEELASIDEVFGEDTCGKSGSNNIRFIVREASDDKGKTYKYYELRCLDSGAKKTFGQKDDGTLFPHRKDEDGNYLPDNGWVKWNKETGKNE